MEKSSVEEGWISHGMAHGNVLLCLCGHDIARVCVFECQVVFAVLSQQFDAKMMADVMSLSNDNTLTMLDVEVRPPSLANHHGVKRVVRVFLRAANERSNGIGWFRR